MSLSKFPKDLIKETLSYLDPYKNFVSKIKIYHDCFMIEDVKIKISGKVHLFSVGKAASYELLALKKYLTNRVEFGQLVSLTKENHTVSDGDILQLEGTHPLITEKNISHTKIFLEKIATIPPQDTLLFLLSGGASALLELPLKGLNLEELKEYHQDLLNSGKGINEINKERKTLSQVKNGKLSNFIKTKNILQLITCDIPNENLTDVGSGPLYPDSGEIDYVTSIKTQCATDLLNFLTKKYDGINEGSFDGSLEELIKKQMENLPKKEERYFSGGEATFEVPKNAKKGGRNTHYVLCMAEKVYKDPKNHDLHIFSLGTDGTDGPTDAAGAYINYQMYKKLDATKFLNCYNSYEYFEKVGGLIKTGPTKTNVMDLRCIWRE